MAGRVAAKASSSCVGVVVLITEAAGGQDRYTCVCVGEVGRS